MPSNTQVTYKLRVNQPLQLMELLLTDFPANSFLSLEGKLTSVLTPKHLYSDREQGLLTRNTRTPRQDFWIFKLDDETKNYLKTDLLKRIGITSNVIHVLTEWNRNILFASYDRFDDDSVLLTQTTAFNDEFVTQLADMNVIRSFKN